MKQSTLLETMALGALCASLITAGRFQANAQAATAPADEILPLVQFDEAPLVDVIKTLARQAHLNIIFDPRVTAVDQTGKSIHPPVSIRMENVTAQNVLEAVLNNNHLRLERDRKVSRVAYNDSTSEGQDIYHGNVNTRWWAQISLVRLTGQNFGKDWQAWGKWWNESSRQPDFNPEIIRWWNGQPEPDKLADSLEESDRKFISDLQAKAASKPSTAGTGTP